MFSYRHIFHAGNHADVLKHLVLLAILRYQTQKDGGCLWIDTHAGAGIYQLNQKEARISEEADKGFLQLWNTLHYCLDELPDLLRFYMETVRSFNPQKNDHHVTPSIYPGSPWLMQHFLRPQDALKLFELHPTDSRILANNLKTLKNKKVALLRENGFDAVKQFLPPPQRRGMVFMDPSYEVKTDYQQVINAVKTALQCFATGTYVVWYPIIPRPEAHGLPRKLKTLATKLEKPWLNLTLSVPSASSMGKLDKTSERASQGNLRESKLLASGVFIINPPYTLTHEMQEILPWVAKGLKGNDRTKFTITESAPSTTQIHPGKGMADHALKMLSL